MKIAAFRIASSTARPQIADAEWRPIARNSSTSRLAISTAPPPQAGTIATIEPAGNQRHARRIGAERGVEHERGAQMVRRQIGRRPGGFGDDAEECSDEVERELLARERARHAMTTSSANSGAKSGSGAPPRPGRGAPGPGTRTAAPAPRRSRAPQRHQRLREARGDDRRDARRTPRTRKRTQ